MRSALCMTVVSCSARPAGGSIPACANCSPLWRTIASTCARTARLSTAVIAKTPMPRALAEEIAWDFWNNTEDLGEVMLSGENMSYLMERGHGVVDRIKFIGNNYTVITDPAQIPEDIVKVSVYLVDGVEPFVERFVPKWQQANCAVAGPKWIDTTVANTGIGVQSICRVLDIDPADVMAFGDNYNDVAMLDLVGHPYIMSTAAAELRRRYANHTPRPEDTLRAFLARQEN